MSESQLMLIEELQHDLAKWKRRAIRFREAYRNGQGEILGHQLREMTWEADGGADAVLRQRVHSAQTKMLAACIERNELRAKLKDALTQLVALQAMVKE